MASARRPSTSDMRRARRGATKWPIDRPIRQLLAPMGMNETAPLRPAKAGEPTVLTWRGWRIGEARRTHRLEQIVQHRGDSLDQVVKELAGISVMAPRCGLDAQALRPPSRSIEASIASPRSAGSPILVSTGTLPLSGIVGQLTHARGIGHPPTIPLPSSAFCTPLTEILGLVSG